MSEIYLGVYNFGSLVVLSVSGSAHLRVFAILIWTYTMYCIYTLLRFLCSW